MSELLREIEEDIRRDRFEKLWHSLGKTMVAASVVVVLATIAVVVMQSRKQEQKAAGTSQIIRGIDRLNIEDYKGAAAVFEPLTGDPASPYYGLAMLRRAQAEAASGDTDTATRTYKSLAAQPTPEGELGGLLSGEISAPPKDRNAPFYYLHHELAAWQLLEDGRKEEAVKAFTALAADLEAPYGARERLREALQHLAPEAAEKKEPAHE